jgi:hypothetical protein
MGYTSPVIKSVQANEYGKILVDTSEGKRYHADISSFGQIYCFPRDLASWMKVSIDSYGLGLIWSTRFEVHVDQVMGLATKVEDIKHIA